MIKIRDISKQFTIKNNIVKALSNINLEILEKDCFAIVGESGCLLYTSDAADE